MSSAQSKWARASVCHSDFIGFAVSRCHAPSFVPFRRTSPSDLSCKSKTPFSLCVFRCLPWPCLDPCWLQQWPSAAKGAHPRSRQIRSFHLCVCVSGIYIYSLYSPGLHQQGNHQKKKCSVMSHNCHVEHQSCDKPFSSCPPRPSHGSDALFDDDLLFVSCFALPRIGFIPPFRFRSAPWRFVGSAPVTWSCQWRGLKATREHHGVPASDCFFH